MELIAFIYLVIVFWLLKGTSKTQKMWIGSAFVLLVVTFIVGTLFIRYKTGFFQLDKWDWLNSGASMTMGKWVVPFYIVLSLSLLALIVFRLMKKYWLPIKEENGSRSS